MEIVPNEVFGMHVDVPFLAPMGITSAKLEDFSAQLCDGGTGFGLRPDQIRLKRWDELFGYELSAQFFGENGSLVRTADRMKFGIRNARTVGDWKIMRDTLLRFYTLLDFAPATVTTLSLHAHGRFPSTADRDNFLQRFSYTPLVGKPAALGYVQILDWEKDIRVLIEQSNVVPDAVFVMWDTQFTNQQDWPTFIDSFPILMETSANLFDLSFEPMREKV